MTLNQTYYKKLTLIGTILFLLIGAVVVYFYFQSTKMLREEINQKTTSKIEYFQEKVGNFFEKREVLLDAEAVFLKQLLKDRILEAGVNHYLTGQFTHLKQEYGIVDFFVGYPDGVIDSGPNLNLPKSAKKSYDRPWYQKSMQSKDKIVYTDIYKDFNSGNLVLTMSKYINDGENEAVVGIDIGLMQLIKLMESEKFGNEGYAFIVDSKGKFIIHPQYTLQPEGTDTSTIYNIEEGEFKKTGEILLTNEMEMIRAAYQGKEKVYMSKRIGKTELFLIVGIDQNGMRTQLNVLLLHHILIFAILGLSYGLLNMWAHWKMERIKIEEELNQ